MGGAYYTFNAFMNQISVFAAVYVYNEYYSETGEGMALKLSAQSLWAFATILFSLWVALCAYFLVNICVREYWHNFYNLETNADFAFSLFNHVVEGEMRAREDEVRITIFTYNRVCWKEYEEEVREWTHRSWATWVESKPDWFTPEVVATVPDVFIPKEHLIVLGGNNRKRRASAVGSVRESLRQGDISGGRREEVNSLTK